VCLQLHCPLQELQHGAGQHGAGQHVGAGQHGAGHGAGQHGFCVAQPAMNRVAAVTAKARPVFIVIYPLDKIDGKFFIFVLPSAFIYSDKKTADDSALPFILIPKIIASILPTKKLFLRSF
jgi:hypothetical protein